MSVSQADDDLVKIRKRINEALALGLFDHPAAAAGITRETIQQTMNEATRAEQACDQEIERLLRQAENLRGKAEGFKTMRGLLFAIFNALVSAQERSVADRQAADAASAAVVAVAIPVEAPAPASPEPTAPSEEEPAKRRKRKV